MTVDAERAAELGRNWLEGWNAGDVDVIMGDFADDVVFSSPFVGRFNEGRTTIEGHDALRTYVSQALQRTPGIRYELDATMIGTDGVVLLYTCALPNGTTKTGADSMRVDADGKVVDWRCHYTAESMPG